MTLQHELAMILFPVLKAFVKKPVVLSMGETMDALAKGASIARYGDGEIEAITQNIENSFEDNSQSLAEEMINSINRNQKNVVKAIAQPFSWNMSNMSKDAKNYWYPLLIKNWSSWQTILDRQEPYYNAMVTRPYFDYRKSKTRGEINQIFSRFKSLWSKKNILIVEGEFSRFGIGNDLLDSANSVKRIICPAVNAFEGLTKIQRTIRGKTDQSNFDIILFSLGQTASILVTTLANIPIQKIDIGHLDVEYYWFKINAEKKVTVPGKWVNEAPRKFKEYEDAELLTRYKEEIIAVI